MIRSLWIARTGLDAQQTQLDVISNNLANVSTNGFKRSRAVFEDLLYQNLRQPGAQSSQQTQIPTGLQLGTGVRPVATAHIFTQGNLQKTDNALDLAAQGSGFFQILLPDGTTGYTRDGSFQKDNQGQIVTSDGYPLQPNITIPAVGNLHQSGWLAKHRSESLSGNCCQRYANAEYAGNEWCRYGQSRLCRNLQCQRGGGVGDHDPDSACLRVEFQGDFYLRRHAGASDATVR